MRSWQRRLQRGFGVLATATTLACGCNHDSPDLHYLGDSDLQYYRGHATEVEYPAITTERPENVVATEPPRTIREKDKVPVRDLTLAEAVFSALHNSDVIRSAGTFLSPGNGLYSNPNGIDSVYDPAIQETGVLFGGRGVEAALSAFDAQLDASMVWGKNEQIQNNIFFAGGLQPGRTLLTETGNFQASLSKTFAHGGSVSLNHNVNYLWNDSPGQLFPSVYTGDVNLQYQLPLLAGSGAEFTRIAGPIGQSFGGLTGVSQGVVIARINNDLALADFEAAVRDLVRDVETTYWDLYLAYRTYHTAMTAKESALLTWRIADLQFDGGVRTRAEVAQARDQYFAAQAATDNSQSGIYTAEVRLRRLIGMPVNDGTTIRPADEPVTAELVPDWYVSLSEALVERVELRRQKWNIKSLDLQLRAAKSLTKPRLDFVGGYNVNGFGDNLLSQNDDDEVTNAGLNSYYETITQGNQTGWNLGLIMNMPLGFRSAHTQVQNYELRLAKAQAVLKTQEEEVSLELAAAFQELARAYSAARTNMNRLIAARENVRFLEPNIREGDKLLDDLLRAQLRQAEAEVAYYTSLVEYNKALLDLQYRKGTLLEYNNVLLSEGGWDPEAYEWAERRSEARSHAFSVEAHKGNVPEAFATPDPVDHVYFTTPTATRLSEQPTPVPSAEPKEPATVPAEEPAPNDDAGAAEEATTMSPVKPGKVTQVSAEATAPPSKRRGWLSPAAFLRKEE